jgi:hypothetical protein
MEAVRTSETSVYFNETTRRYNSEDSKHHFSTINCNTINVFKDRSLKGFLPFEFRYKNTKKWSYLKAPCEKKMVRLIFHHAKKENENDFIDFTEFK